MKRNSRRPRKGWKRLYLRQLVIGLLVAGGISYLCAGASQLWAAGGKGHAADADDEDFSLNGGNTEEILPPKSAPRVKSEPPKDAAGTKQANQSETAPPPANAVPAPDSILPASDNEAVTVAPHVSAKSSPNPVEVPSENSQQPADSQAGQTAAGSAAVPHKQDDGSGEQSAASMQPGRDKPFSPLPDTLDGSSYGPKVPIVSEPNEFGGIPVVAGTRKVLAREEAPERYTVEAGDTLYDICDQLLDESNYWPKLWSLNPFIKNPHFIYPGMQLVFHGGDEETPPFLQVVTEDDVVPIDKANLIESDLVREDISKLLVDSVMPKPTQVIGPGDLNPEIQVPFDSWGTVFKPEHMEITIPAFIFKDERNPVGTVVGGEKGKFLSTTGELVVIRTNDQLNPQTKYTILRTGDKIYTRNDNDYVGIRYEFIAHISVNEKLENDLYNAKIFFDRLGIKPGDIVVPYLSTTRSVPVNPVAISKQADGSEVVAFTYPMNKLGGRHSVVMLSNHDSVQLNEGDVVGVYHQLSRTFTSFLTDLPDNKMRIAVVYIIASTDAVSIGYVMDAQFELSVGDMANKGAKM